MSKDDYFKPLTGYRAMAAYMVFCVHFNPFASGTFFQSFFAGFGIGVPLFFVLSGFLIYTRYNTSEVSASFYKKYMINRFARIYPVYFLITTATLLFNYKAAALSLHWLKIYFLNITFLRGFFEAHVGSLVGQGWSLTVEEVFYVLAPLIFLLGRDSIKRYWILFFILFLTGWILSYISIDLLHGYFWTNPKFMLLNTFWGHSFAFIVGIMVGVLNKRIGAIPFKYVTVIGFLGLFTSLLLLSRVNNVTDRGAENVFTWRGILVYNFMAVPFIGAIIWGLIHKRTYISRLLPTNVFQALGKSSYSFYLIHLGIIYTLIHKFITENLFLFFSLLVLAALVLWRFIEEPLNERIRAGAAKLMLNNDIR